MKPSTLFRGIIGAAGAEYLIVGIGGPSRVYLAWGLFFAGWAVAWPFRTKRGR